jgi:hypothetical protein
MYCSDHDQFAETNNPLKVSAEEDTLDPTVRLGMQTRSQTKKEATDCTIGVMHSLGFRLLDFHYIQPPLDAGSILCSLTPMITTLTCSFRPQAR